MGEVAIHRQWFDPDPDPDPIGPPDTGDSAGDGPAGRDPIVLLHEGLGSVSAWGPFPGLLATGTGRRVLAYDRRGYGRSGPHPGPWPARFLHHEAALLPGLLVEEGISDGMILVGHSDGASIALLYPSQARAGSPRPGGIVSMAAHLLVEEIGVAAIAETARTYPEALRDRLARHHNDVDATFGGWSDVWLSDRFRPWTIDDEVREVACPVLAIQGAQDRYGTRLHLDRLAAAATGAVEVHELQGVDHWPYREATTTVIDLIDRFCRRLRRT